MNKKLEMAIKYASRFTTFANAANYCKGCVKSSCIIMGNDGYFWIVPTGIAFSLVKLGYEGFHLGLSEEGICWKQI